MSDENGALFRKFRPRPSPKHLHERAGAEALKKQLEEHWRRAGFRPPTITLHAEPFDMNLRGPRYDVRSDMVNGLPRK